MTELARRGERCVPVGVSARHIHLSTADIERLFGPGHTLTPYKKLSQPGQFAATECLTVIGPKGKIEKVRILGPARAETQVELAFSDVFRLGLKDVPVRMSGKLAGTPGIRLAGPAGEIAVDHGVIVAARHIHMSLAQAQAYGVHDGMSVSVRVDGIRPCVLKNVICRVGDGHLLDLHLDTDEANACALKTGNYVELVLSDGCSCGSGKCSHSGGVGKCSHNCGCKGDKPSAVAKPESPEEILDLVVERNINEAVQKGKHTVFCERSALITPSAADRAAELGVKITRLSDPLNASALVKPAEGREVLELVTEADLNEAFLTDLKEIYCRKCAVVTDAAQDRAFETGIQIVRV